jgi:ketosteroid isomerase-like protein
MKKLFLTSVAVLLTVGALVAQQPAKPAPAKSVDGVADALIKLERQWEAASKSANADALAPLLAEDFVALDSDGSMRTKTETLARTKKGKWTVNEIGDLKVVVHGDAAVVTGSWTGKGTDGSGKAVDAKERWADTWVKTAGGKWQCVASASAPSK